MYATRYRGTTGRGRLGQVAENLEIQVGDEKKCLSRIKTLVRCLQKLYAMLITSNVAGEAANSWIKIR